MESSFSQGEASRTKAGAGAAHDTASQIQHLQVGDRVSAMDKVDVQARAGILRSQSQARKCSERSPERLRLPRLNERSHTIVAENIANNDSDEDDDQKRVKHRCTVVLLSMR